MGKTPQKPTNCELNTYPGLRIDDFGEHSTNNTNEIITRDCPSPSKKGDFGDEDDQARILRNKTNIVLNTCP